MSLRIFEIAERQHRIQNPISEDKIMLLGQICRLRPGMRVLDLACGKGEMLCRWAQTYGVSGVGIDISGVFLDAAHKRARELGVDEQVTFVQSDAGKYEPDGERYDIVSCLGATWIGNGTVGTLRLMQPAATADGFLLVGEPYWIDPPPDEAYDLMGLRRDEYTTLAGLLDRFKAAECELLDMVLATPDNWDRYHGQQWMEVCDFLRANPHDPDAHALREWLDRERRTYFTYGRRYMGWGVFVLRTTDTGKRKVLSTGQPNSTA